jgi:hypothetical protein
MIVYAAAVIHPANSSDYAMVAQLAKNTITSILANQGPMRVVVACNQTLDLGLNDERYCEVITDLPPPSKDTNSGIPLNAMLLDKGRKLLKAIDFAQQLDPRYVVIFDADDYVSNKINTFLTSQSERCNWYVDQGYVWAAGAPHMKPTHNFVDYCGTSLVFDNETLVAQFPNLRHQAEPSAEAPSIPESEDAEHLIKTLGNHREALPYLGTHGAAFKPLPFPAAVWVRNTGLNHNEILFQDIGFKVSPDQLAEFNLVIDPAVLDGFTDTLSSVLFLRLKQLYWRTRRLLSPNR